MNKYATKETCIRVLVWIVWFVAVLVAVCRERERCDRAVKRTAVGNCES